MISFLGHFRKKIKMCLRAPRSLIRQWLTTVMLESQSVSASPNTVSMKFRRPQTD